MADLASLVIKVDSRDVERARSGLNALGIDAQRAERSVSSSADRIKSSMGGVDTAIRAAAAALATFAGARAFVQIADQMKLLESRIRLTMTATEDFTAIQRQLVQVANSSRASLQDIGTLYARLAVPIQKLGGTTNETVGIANALSKALLLSGASAQEASSAIIQFSQAMGKGVLNGDEFRSIAENAPIVLRLMEQQLGKTNAELRKMAEDGKLTADVIGNVLLANLNNLEKQASTIPMTVGQAFVLFKNNLALAVDEFEKATGAADGLANVIGSMAASIGPAIRLLTDLAKILFQFEGSAQAFDVLGQAVKIAFQTILVVGGNVAFVLRGIVQEVVTLGRQAVSVFQGDFATAANIGARSARDAEQARVAFDAWEKSVMNFGQASKDAGGQAGTAAQEFRKLGNGAAEVDEKAKKAAEALRKLREQFAAQIADQRLINTLIMQGMEAEQARERVQLARAGALGAEIEQLTQLRAQEDALLETRKMMVEEIEAEDKVLVDLIKSYEKNTEELAKQNDALAEQVRAQLNQNEALGLTGEALALVEANRIRETQAQLQQKIVTLEGIQGREAEIEQLRRQIELLDDLADARIAGAVKADDIKRAKEAIEVQQKEAQQLERIFQDVGRSLTDSLFRGFESGKGFLRSFVDSIKNTFKSLVIRFAVQPVLTSIAGSLAGALGFSGAANASTGSAGGFGGGFIEALSGGKSIIDALSGSFTSGLSSFASSLGSAGFSSGASFVNGFSSALSGGGQATFAGASTAFNLGNFAGQAAPFAGAVISALQGDLKGAAFQGAGAAIGTALGGPIGGFIGSTIGSLVSSLFGGGGPKAISTQALTTRQGSAAGRDGKAGNIEGILDGIGSINAQFITRLDSLLEAAGVARAADLSVASEIGLFDKRRRGGFNFQISAGGREIVSGANDTFGNDVKVIAEALTKDLFGPALRDAFIALAEDVVSPAIRDFLSAVETPEEIEQRIGVITQLQGASELLNDKFGATVDQMVQLANEGGNIAAVLEGLNGLISPIEALELQAQRLQERFTALGVSAPVNAEALRSMIQQIDKSTAAGRELAAGLAQLAPAFQQVEAARQQALDAADQQILGIFGAIVAERDAARATLQSLVDERVRAIEDTASAFDDIIASLRDFRQELEFIAGDTGPFALSIRRAQFEGVARRAALGDIEAAQSLPDVGRGLLEVAAEQSATREDFLRELARVRNGVDAAEATALRQKSIQEQQLDALREQVEGLVDLNASQLTIEQAVANLETAEAAVQTASRQLEALGLINTSVLSLDDRLRELAAALGVAVTERQRIAATGGVTQAVQTQVAAVQAANSVVNGLAATIVTDRERQIAGVYQSLLGRSADIGGLGSFAASSLTIAQIEDAVRGSEEFRVRQGGAAAQNEFNRLVNAALGSSTNIQAFASGGMFSGGLRIVGERGRELEATGPSRIWNAQQTRDFLSGGADMTGVENRLERVEAALFTIAKNTARTSDQLQRWDGDGVPPVRDEAA
jgi:tape measure domain-containing protein